MKITIGENQPNIFANIMRFYALFTDKFIWYAKYNYNVDVIV